MIEINRADALLGETLATFKNNLVEQHCNITRTCLMQQSTPQRDQHLLDYYRSKGISDYQLHISHTAITSLPFNQSIDLSFMEKSPYYEPYLIKANTYHAKDYPQADALGSKYVPLVSYDASIVLPMICEDGVAWMTPELFEETTMRPCVLKAHGHVLVIGLGIGFFLFNILLKKSVKHVTVVERNESIVNLFREHILPQFPRQDDFDIVLGDAYDYLSNECVQRFDYTFVDIWRNESDGMLILSDCYKNLDFRESLSIDFWVEDSILENVKECVMTYLVELYEGNLAYHLRAPLPLERRPETIIGFRQIHEYFQERHITLDSAHGLVKFVNDKAMLRDLLKHL